jgi:opacity protein-like surface antigen
MPHSSRLQFPSSPEARSLHSHVIIVLLQGLHLFACLLATRSRASAFLLDWQHHQGEGFCQCYRPRDVDRLNAPLSKGRNFEMIRLVVATIALIALTCPLAFAQGPTPKVQVFGGYSFVHLDNGGFTPETLFAALREPNNPFAVASNFNGWNAEGQYNFSRVLGVVADAGGHYGTPIIQSDFSKLSGLPKATAYSLLVGPVLSYRTKSKLTPFIHALFGFERTSLSASTISGLANPLSSSATNATDAALALGGGLDYRLYRRFSLRLVQVDEFRTYHNFNKFYDSAFNTNLFYGIGLRQNNIRISTGITARF